MKEDVNLFSVSVIVPFFNSEDFLPNFFDVIDQNNFYDGDEIILIDNGSTDKSRKICEEVVSVNPSLYKYYYFGDKAGSYCARNYAADLAVGDILVFTDSDCKPDKNWINEIREEIEPGIIIAGDIRIEIENKTVWEYYDSIAHLNSERNASHNSVATANMSVLRSDFQNIGKFEERFSGGDYEWSQRASKGGMKIQYLQSAFVLHPSRKTFKENLIKEQRISFGDGNHYRLQNKNKRRLVFIYILRIFKIDTNIRYTRRLRKLGVKVNDLVCFNIRFVQIRINKLIYAIKGYNQEDARLLNIK